MPDVTNTDAARRLGVSRARIGQLRPDTAPARQRAKVLSRSAAKAAALSDGELLAQVIARSGKSARRFAVEDLQRGERTIRRWLRGDTAPTRAVREKLERMFTGAAS